MKRSSRFPYGITFFVILLFLVPFQTDFFGKNIFPPAFGIWNSAQADDSNSEMLEDTPFLDVDPVDDIVTQEVLREGMESASYTYYLPYFLSSKDYWTGVALKNGSTSWTASVTVYGISKAGSLIDTQSKTIPPKGQTAFMMKPGEGWAKVISDLPLTGLSFVAESAGDALMFDMTLIPGLAKVLHVPHVAQDATWDTIVYVCNPNGSETTMYLTFVKSDGTVVTCKKYTLPVNGSGKYPLSGVVGAGSYSSGSIEITASQGVAAFALYQNLKTGVSSYAGISAVEPEVSLVAPTTCTYTIDPASKSFTSTAGTGSVTVTASSSTCAWTATSNAAWLHITSGSSGKGNGTVSYAVDANTNTSSRTGTLTIAGKIFTVTQAGKPQLNTFTNSIGMTFIQIPAGTFMMGSPSSEPGGTRNETQHQVTLTKSFYFQETEVTQGQWKAIMGSNPSYFSDCGDNCPVDSVSWNDCQLFIAKLNQLEGTTKYRLPTEAEWEYACRAGTTTPFNTGNCLSTDQANYSTLIWITGDKYEGECPYADCPVGIFRKKTVPVKSFPPNAWGLYEMHGNVKENCQDLFGYYPSSPVTDPEGALSGEFPVGDFPVIRGGDWRKCLRTLRSAYRGEGLYPSKASRHETTGLRVVRDY